MLDMFLVVRNDDGVYVPRTLNGSKYVLPSELHKALDDLIAYYTELSDDDVASCNRYIQEQLAKEWNKPRTEEEKQAEYLRSLKNRQGYIYLLKCADKYKIGFSKDVDRRIKELNNRPFEVVLLQKWYYEQALDIEQALHNIYEEFKIDPSGEWYGLTLPINQLENTIEQLKDTYPIVIK